MAIAEVRLREALIEFGQAAKSTYQGRLFSEDALQGLKIIDLCREVFDVVVMNPPFGEPSAGSAAYVKKNYPRSKNDIYATFVENAYTRCRDNGYVGAITARTGFFLTSFTPWRRELIISSTVFESMIDLGYNVLDGAVVETAAYVFRKRIPEPGKRAVFIRLIDEEEKQLFEKQGFRDWHKKDNVYLRSVTDFLVLPAAEFAYWVEQLVLDIFSKFEPIEPSRVLVKQGIATGDNQRFLRLPTELVNNIKNQWRSYAKGGDFARFYSDLGLTVKWYEDGKEIKARAEKEYGSASRTVKNTETFGFPGITYTLVTTSGFSCRPFPSGSIYDMTGPVIFPANKDEKSRWVLLGFLNSRAVQSLLSLITDSRHWHVIAVQRIPMPDFTVESETRLANAAMRSCQRRMKLWSSDETSPLFVVDSFYDNCFQSECVRAQAEKEIKDAVRDEELIEKDVTTAFGIDLSALHMHTQFFASDHRQLMNAYLDNNVFLNASARFSYLLGVVFGRWDIKYATGESTAPGMLDPFSTLPVCSPAQLQNEGGYPLSEDDVLKRIQDNTWSYPIDVPWSGILVNDPGHPLDIQKKIGLVLDVIFRERSGIIEANLCKELSVPSLSDYVQRPAGFFADHLRRYSKNRRQAPLYWPLSSSYGGYTLWVYFPRLSSQTLYTAINDFVGPKLKQVGAERSVLHNKGKARTRDDEKHFEALQAFEFELVELRDTLLKLAPNYHPNHDDGVQISAAPLWPLFRHKPWQKVLKDTWTKLEKGEYDWAHLAMNYWPERVREKCKTDKSLAIAHGLEHLYVEPEAAAKKSRGRKKAG